MRKTRRLVIADTGWQSYGVAAELCRLLCEEATYPLIAPPVMLGMAATPCPTTRKLETDFYPTQRSLVDSIARLVRGRANHDIALPEAKATVPDFRSLQQSF